MAKHFLGIDPGLSGAFAILDEDGTLATVGDLPVIGSDAQRRIDGANLALVLRGFDDMAAAIEAVSAMPGQGVSSTFRFGHSAGVVSGVVAALGLPVVMVRASKWKRHFHLTADKETSRLRAIECWPRQAHLFARKMDHGRAEAALLDLWLSMSIEGAKAA